MAPINASVLSREEGVRKHVNGVEVGGAGGGDPCLMVPFDKSQDGGVIISYENLDIAKHILVILYNNTFAILALSSCGNGFVLSEDEALSLL